MNKQKQLFTISVYTENNIGLLNRISAIFQRRHINIESLNISPSEIEGVAKFTIVVHMTEDDVKKIIGQEWVTFLFKQLHCNYCYRNSAVILCQDFSGVARVVVLPDVSAVSISVLHTFAISGVGKGIQSTMLAVALRMKSPSALFPISFECPAGSICFRFQ